MFIETYFENWVSFLKCLTIQIPFHIINIISSQPHTAASYHHSDICLPSISSKGVSSLLGTLEGSTFIRKFSCVHGQLLQWCSTLCNPMVCSLPGSSVHGILLARILEWIAMISSRGSLPAEVKPMSLESPALQVDYLLLSHWGSPKIPQVKAISISAPSDTSQKNVCIPQYSASFPWTLREHIKWKNKAKPSNKIYSNP